jgi:hypothetical protein
MSVACFCIRPRRRHGVATVVAWSGVALTLGLAAALVARSCAYDWSAMLRYAGYFAVFVFLPGVVVLQAVTGRPISLTTALALGIPTGFAVEIATFLAASAAGCKQELVLVPVVWVAAAAFLRWRHGQWPLRVFLGARHAGVALGMAIVFLITVISAISQMFAESPMVAGWPQRPIFHDWVYLVSRAAAIKQHWPVEDPSLAGSTLQYHYFLMVHAASASWLTHVEITLILLRLVIVVLGAVLVAQAFALGRLLSRRAWGGVIAAWLTVATTELSTSAHFQQSQFLGLFVRWLYVSPTFFFGMVFFGALLLAVAHCGGGGLRWKQVAWIALLTAAATGAKGTVVPVLLLAMGGWFVWRAARERRLPIGLGLMMVTMAAVFAGVYAFTMAARGNGDASLEPFEVYHITAFWQQHVVFWQRALKHWLHAPDFGTWLGASLCAAAVIAGTLGALLLAISGLVHCDRRRREVAVWLGAAGVASCIAGTVIHLDSNDELYLLLPMRLPLAVLAAGFLAHGTARRRDVTAPAHDAIGFVPATHWHHTRHRAAALIGAGAIAAALIVQSSIAFAREGEGFAAWWRFAPNTRINEDLVPLYEAMHWVRDHTEADAVLVANAFTAPNLRHDRGVLVDHTTAGVHYYYSALGERRLWIEGPTYLPDSPSVRRRLLRAADVFYHGCPPSIAVKTLAPCYVLLDHSIGDGATVSIPATARVFSNGRFEIYRMPRMLMAGRAELAGAQ